MQPSDTQKRIFEISSDRVKFYCDTMRHSGPEEKIVADLRESFWRYLRQPSESNEAPNSFEPSIVKISSSDVLKIAFSFRDGEFDFFVTTPPGDPNAPREKRDSVRSWAFMRRRDERLQVPYDRVSKLNDKTWTVIGWTDAGHEVPLTIARHQCELMVNPRFALIPEASLRSIEAELGARISMYRNLDS